jgi:hypothetical protein
MTVVNQKRNMKDRDSSKQEADHHAKNLPRTAWLMTILQAKNTTVGIVATCSRRGPDLEPSITAEIAYYTHGSLITQNCQWKYLLRPTTSKIAITHHHQLLLQKITWPQYWGNPKVARLEGTPAILFWSRHSHTQIYKQTRNTTQHTSVIAI